MLCDIAAETGNPVSVEAARWTDADLVARLATQEAEAERCPQCRLTEEHTKHVAAVVDSCPACEARDTERQKLGKAEGGAPGRFVRWEILDDADAMQASAWVRFTAEGALARKQYESGGGG